LSWSLRCNDSEELRLIELEKSRRDIHYWLRTWVWTSDPRLSERGMLANVPFDLFECQWALVNFMMARIAAKQDGAIAKSRDMGFSWVAAAVPVWHWRFIPGFKTTYSSYEQSKVDHLGNPDSYFEKIRILLRLLPAWMLPDGYVPSRHDNFMRLVNPTNGNVISGEVGDQMGRGGRSSLYLCDECAFVGHPDAVDAATAANTRCRIFGSTVNGLGNLFARKWHTLPESQKFRLHWSTDPRKTTLDPGWEKRQRSRMEPWVFASEYDMDFSASVEGIFIPAKWVESCQKLRHLPNFVLPPLPTFGVAGQDVGAGGTGKSVYVSRFGPLVRRIVAWGDPDTIETAYRSLDECEVDSFTREDGYDCRIGVLNYDCVGIGDAVLRTYARVGRPGLATQGINTGIPATERRWEDGQTSLEKFGNLKAELWAIIRERCKCSHELYLHLQGQEGGHDHPVVDCLILPDDTPEALTLAQQLSYPRRERNEKGEIVVESKKAMMEKRGLPSPDHADALVLTEAQSGLNIWARLAAA
jgi:phage terminase large subunit